MFILSKARLCYSFYCFIAFDFINWCRPVFIAFAGGCPWILLPGKSQQELVKSHLLPNSILTSRTIPESSESLFMGFESIFYGGRG